MFNKCYVIILRLNYINSPSINPTADNNPVIYKYFSAALTSKLIHSFPVKSDSTTYLFLPAVTVGLCPEISFLEGVWYNTFRIWLRWLLICFLLWNNWVSGTSVAPGTVFVAPYLHCCPHSARSIGLGYFLLWEYFLRVPRGFPTRCWVLHGGPHCTYLEAFLLGA